MKTYGVIMAGGGGTRFWPLSRQNRPKQLLNLSGKDLMINESVDRLGRFIPFDNIFVVTNVSQVPPMVSALKGRISEERILSEPASRNTAACIGYAAVEIVEKYGDGIMCITPADHCIGDVEAFESTLKIAINEAEKYDALITIGIEPTFPATGFGYIKHSNEDNKISKDVVAFVEKPDRETAQKYISDGSYLWNSGMFVWKASTILSEIEKYLPELYIDLSEIRTVMHECRKYDSYDIEKEKDVINKVYPRLQKISIDYGIMEKSSRVRVVPGDFDWHDVGSWDMMDVLHEEDSNGNIKLGDTLLLDTNNSTIVSENRLVATIGINNVVVVETGDAVLVCDKSRAQDVKQIVELLAGQNRNNLL